MANLTGFTGVHKQPTSVGSTVNTCPLGTRAYDTAGNLYVYVQAGESFVPGEWAVYDDGYIATQVGVASRGPAGIVDGTFTSDESFWLMVEGTYTAAIGTSGVTSAGVLIAGTSSDGGYVDIGTSGSGNTVFGALSRSAASTATSPITAGLGLFTVQLARPFLLGELSMGTS